MHPVFYNYHNKFTEQIFDHGIILAFMELVIDAKMFDLDLAIIHQANEKCLVFI